MSIIKSSKEKLESYSKETLIKLLMLAEAEAEVESYEEGVRIGFQKGYDQAIKDSIRIDAEVQKILYGN